MDNLGSFLVILACLVLQGIFSGGELALVSSDINRIRSLAKRGDNRARRTLRLLDQPEWFLATTLTGTNICVVVSTVTATSLSISLFGLGRGEMIAIAFMVPLLLICGEMIPKSIFQQHADFIALRISLVIRLASFVLYPIVFLVARISRGTMRIAKKEKDLTSSYITKDGLRYLLQDQGNDSDILSVEKEMVKRILDFSEVTVEEIMVPLSAMTSLSATASLGEAAEVFSEKRYMRIPVYRDQLINIIGIINYFDLLAAIRQTGNNGPAEPTVEKYIQRRITFVPENKFAKDLLVEMQERNDKMAIVVDEYGGAVGMITMEDILAQIVGSIEDKYDKYKRLAPGRYVVQAHISLEAANQLLPVVLPEGNYETLGGFLLYRMGKIPKRNETYNYPPVRFIIEDADPKAIREILIIFPPELDRVK